MFSFNEVKDPEKSWYKVRNHLLKKYPILWQYDMEYKAGDENRLLKRVMFIAGISEKRLIKEIEEALTTSKEATKSSYYF